MGRSKAIYKVREKVGKKSGREYGRKMEENWG
jgi:hypothetical protein